MLVSQLLMVGIVRNVQLENLSTRLVIILAQIAYRDNILRQLVPRQTSAKGVWQIHTRQPQVTNIQIVFAMLVSQVLTVGIVQNV